MQGQRLWTVQPPTDHQRNRTRVGRQPLPQLQGQGLWPAPGPASSGTPIGSVGGSARLPLTKVNTVPFFATASSASGHDEDRAVEDVFVRPGFSWCDPRG